MQSHRELHPFALRQGPALTENIRHRPASPCLSFFEEYSSHIYHPTAADSRTAPSRWFFEKWIQHCSGSCCFPYAGEMFTHLFSVVDIFWNPEGFGR
jgi:hypothetical protein